MHYGHPDFVDLFCARSRGGVSKATPHINLSEDIFAGLNVRNRERSDFVDVLEMCVLVKKIGRQCWRVEVVQMFDRGHKRDEHGGSVECLLRHRRLLRVHCTVYLFLFMHILLALASWSTDRSQSR